MAPHPFMLVVPLLLHGCAPPQDDGIPAELAVDEGTWAIGGTSLHYRIVGEGDPVMLLHGGPGGNLQGWEPLEELGHEYRLIMYDQRGSGDSERLDLAWDNQDSSLMSVERHVADLEEIRVLLGHERLTLLGHSWGATLATFYAANHPDRVDRLLLYNGGPMWTDLQEARQAEQEARLTEDQLAALDELDDQLNANITTWSQDQLDDWFVAVASIYFTTLVCDPGSLDSEDPGRGGFWANYLTNQYVDTFDPDTFAPRLGLVTAPSLVTWGACEPNPIERHTYLRDALPEATMVIFEESGHQALTEQHDLFVATVRAFLAGEELPLPAYLGPS